MLMQGRSARAEHEVNLTIGHRPEIRLDDSEADQILKVATEAVASKDGPNDVPCDITLKRSGAVKISNDYPIEINSEAQFNAAKGLKTSIIVVDRIRYCGGFGPGILGCAPVPGDFLVVVRKIVSDGRSGPAIEGVVWAHEFGHNRGLSHNFREHALMYPSAQVKNRELDQSESQTYATGKVGVQPILVANSDSKANESKPDLSPSLQPIEQVVRAAYPHGLPYSLLKQYPEESAKKLREMLRNPAEKAYHGQIAGALCIIGGPTDFGMIKSFIEGSVKPEDDVAIGNKEMAITALGYLLAKTNSDQVLQFLSSSVTDQGWEKRNLSWLMPKDVASAKAIKNMKMAAIAALALSGTEKARTVLQFLADEKLGPADEDPNVQAIIKQAPNELDKVKQMGLENYSRHEPNR